MAKPGNKPFRPAALTSPAHRAPSVIPGLGVDVPELQQTRGLWQLNRWKTKAVASPTYEAVSQPLYTSAMGRWKNYRRYLEPCLAILQPFIEAFGYQDSHPAQSF